MATGTPSRGTMNVSDVPWTPNATHESPRPASESGYSLWEMGLIVFLSGAVSLITIVGNLLVMVSFKVNRELKTVNNYFLLSLAGADLIIGTISMNLYTTYIVMGRWAMGNLACDLWLCLDYVASNASVMNLLIISFDRYFSITHPLSYRAKRTPKRAAVMIGLAWLISIVLWAPAILFWQNFVGKRTVPETECQIQFLSEPIITFGTAIAAFYLPVTIMAILYWKIYQETQKRAKELSGLQGLGLRESQPMKLPNEGSSAGKRSSPKPGHPVASLSNGVIFSQQTSCFPSRQPKGVSLDRSSNSSWNTTEEDEVEEVSADSSLSEGEEESFEVRALCSAVIRLPVIDAVVRRAQCRALGKDWVGGKVVVEHPKPPLASKEVPVPPPRETMRAAITKSHILRKKRRDLLSKQKTSSLGKERKAARTLSAILLAFIITWTPYNIMVLVSAFCTECIPQALWKLGYWLCYVNSTVNPMCYALCNRSFRTTFRQLLQGQCQSSKERQIAVKGKRRQAERQLRMN